MAPVTEKALNIPPFIVMDVLERVHEPEREGRRIIHLEVGEPDFPTASCICEAAVVKALQEKKTHYTHSLGLLEPREAICEDYHKKYGVSILNSPSNPAGNLLSPDRMKKIYDKAVKGDRFQSAG
jgi:(5-formylfuran-3-yl)methyl phosphate transaminase